MYTLDSHPEDIINDPRSPIQPICRSTIRVRRWGDKTLRELLSRPIHRDVVASCEVIRKGVWEDCDEELKAEVLRYLERAYG